MKLSISSELVVGETRMNSLSMSAIADALGTNRSSERIALHGGATRVREVWGATGITSLRDDEEEAVCLIAAPDSVEVIVDGRTVSKTEREFVEQFPVAEKQVGHSYRLVVARWLLHFDFSPAKKWRGVGSTVRRLSRVTVGLKERANQPPQRNAGSRPSEGDSPAPETPSSLGPRG